MAASGELLPFFSQGKRDRQVVNRRPFAAVVTAFVVIRWIVGFHLFSTASRFMAALATIIHDASSSSCKSRSRLLSPTAISVSAEP